MPKNSSNYSREYLAAIKGRIKAAMKRLGIEVGGDEGKAAAASKALWDAAQGLTEIFSAMRGSMVEK